MKHVSYAATITRSRMTSLAPNVNYNGSNFVKNIHRMLFCINVEFKGLKIQT